MRELQGTLKDLLQLEISVDSVGLKETDKALAEDKGTNNSDTVRLFLGVAGWKRRERWMGHLQYQYRGEHQRYVLHRSCRGGGRQTRSA